ncbi:MAG: hypothetical protein JWM05_2389, partial [Acidimicrobiales bacterium]|nr:hypothetical protein [Acidimicrobiales bacterium]
FGEDVTMALSSEERLLLHQRFTKSIGEDGAVLVMSQFPIDEAHEPATKDFVHAEINGLRAEMHEGFGSLRAETGSLRAEMYEGFGSLRAEMHEGFGSLRAEMHSLIRQQTVWFVGTMISGLGLCTALAHLIS